MNEGFSPDPPQPSLAEGEDPLLLLPVRPTLNRGFGILQQPQLADQAQRRTDPHRSDLTQLSAELAAETMWEFPLPFGFTIPIWSHPPADLRVGGETPGWREQLESVYYGQRTDRGFNLFGLHVALPGWAGGLIRTHESASLAFTYRNATGIQRALAGVKLDALHPGYTNLIDSETPPLLNPFRELLGQGSFGCAGFCTGAVFYLPRKRDFLWREDDEEPV